VHWHWPATQTPLPVQDPQVPPQPSLPHTLPAQLGVQQSPALQTSPPAQVPQVPPQPSLPHVLPVQLGTHWQAPALQTSLLLQVPQVPPQPSSPHVLPAQLGVQQTPFWQRAPDAQVPQVLPQPSSPHVLPAHAGVHAGHLWVCVLQAPKQQSAFCAQYSPPALHPPEEHSSRHFEPMQSMSAENFAFELQLAGGLLVTQALHSASATHAAASGQQPAVVHKPQASAGKRPSHWVASVQVSAQGPLVQAMSALMPGFFSQAVVRLSRQVTQVGSSAQVSTALQQSCS
jgi:hypothetical protein